MTRSVLAILLLVALVPGYAFGQQAGDGLNDQQRLGRLLVAQSCGVCHLPPTLNAKTYGPPLNKGAGGGDDGVMREYILDGTPRMPGFKYYLQAAEIDAIIAYVKTIPIPQPTAAGPR